MRFLLDTHIWIWSLLEPDKLKKSVAHALNDQENEFWLSPVSIWELSMLVKKRRIEIDEDVDDWVIKALAQGNFREAPLTIEVALEVSRMRFSHRDPADHFIAASAKIFDLTLITADPRLLKLRGQGLSLLAN